MAESFAPPLCKDPGIQSRCHSHPPVRCRDLGSLLEADQGYLSSFTNAACALSLVAKWQEYVSNDQVLKRASPPSMESILLQVQLRWAGYITRMEDVSIPTAVFFSEPQEGKRDRGAPRKRHKDQLKTACTGGNQPSVMVAGELKPIQLALISEKSLL